MTNQVNFLAAVRIVSPSLILAHSQLVNNHHISHLPYLEHDLGPRMQCHIVQVLTNRPFPYLSSGPTSIIDEYGYPTYHTCLHGPLGPQEKFQ